jgi:stearoyl-CoA desaturase (delta-9 desaturase)
VEKSTRVITDQRPLWGQVALYTFVVGPFLGVAAAVLCAAMHTDVGVGWINALLFLVFFVVTGHGVTVGFHRYLTHRSFAARRPLRIGLAVAGTMALQGSPIFWVADHRKHHAFSDRDGDPHSPWRFGTSPWAVARGLWWAHLGWLFDRNKIDTRRYAPDLLADPGIVRVDRPFPVLTVASVLLPALLGWLLTGLTWHGAWTALLWAGLARVFLLHHVTFSINSICHVIGTRPFSTRDRSTNFWPLAVLSFGESWHNFHHARPTSARHGVERGQIDSSARLIALFEKAGWCRDVRWPQTTAYP